MMLYPHQLQRRSHCYWDIYLCLSEDNRKANIALVCKVAPGGQTDERETDRSQCQHLPQTLRGRVQLIAHPQASLESGM